MSGKDDNNTFAGFDPLGTGEDEPDDDPKTWHDGPDDVPPATGLSATPPAAEDDGERIGQYRIIGVLGEGGMGVVYKARQESPRRLVAVKVIHGHMATPAMRARFGFEAEVLARLDHPGIAKIYEAVQDGARSWFAMEFVDGGPLDEWADINDLDLDGRLALVARVCDAVHHAHMKGVVHRDLKPGNVIVDGGGQPKILDFGIARAVSDDMDPGIKHTRAGQLVGTPAYMSPEQATLGGDDLDARSDVYALGVIVWELLTGKLPHDLSGKTLTEMVRVIREVDAPLLSRVRQNIPVDVTSIVAKALQKHPEDRYQSAAALGDDIRRYLADEPISARRASTLQQVTRLARRNKLVSGLVASLVASAGVGLAVVSVMYVGMQDAYQQAEEQRRSTVAANADLEARNAALVVMRARSTLDSDPTLALAWLKTLGETAAWDDAFSVAHEAQGRGVASDLLVGHSDEIRRVDLSPDGTTAVTASYDDTLRVWNLTDRSWISLDAHQADVRFAEFSPDGTRLVSADREGRVYLWPTQDWAAPKALERHQGSIEHMAWSPDGAHVASASEDGLAMVWDAAGSLVRRIDTGVELAHISWLADGSAVVTAGNEGHLALWPLDGAEPTAFSGGGGEVMWVDAAPDGSTLLSAATDGTVRLWDLQDGSHEVLLSQVAEARAVAYTPDGRSGVAIDRAGHLATIDLASGSVRLSSGHNGVVRTLAVSPDGQSAATGGDDGDVWLWDLGSGTGRRLRGHQGRVRLVTWSADGTRILSASADGTARIWPVSGRRPARLVGHTNTVMRAAFEPHQDGQRLSTVSEDGTVRDWDLRTGAATVFDGHTDEVDDVVWRADGKARATAGRDGRVWWTWPISEPVELRWREIVDRIDVHGTRVAGAARSPELPLWDVRDGSHIELLGHTDRIGDVTFSPDGSGLVSGSFDGTVRYWDLATETSAVLRTFDDSITEVCYAPDGASIAASSEDGHVVLWNAQRELLTSTRIEGAARSLAWAPASDRVAIAGADHAVTLLSTDGAVTALKGHTGEVAAVAFLGPDRVASAGADRVVRIWDLQTGESTRLTGHQGAIRFIEVAPNHRFFVTGGEDAALRVWPTDVPRGHDQVRALLDQLTTVQLAPGTEQMGSAWRDVKE